MDCFSNQANLSLQMLIALPAELQFVEFTGVAGEKAPAKSRKRIINPQIKGPIETGWGATHYSPEEAKRILLNLPVKP